MSARRVPARPARPAVRGGPRCPAVSRFLRPPPHPTSQTGQDPRHSPSASRGRSEEHTSELQSRENLVCRLLLEKKIRPLTSTYCFFVHSFHFSRLLRS